jgi:hypothetical protein
MHQRLSPAIVLHYDPPSRDLRAWFWCVWLPCSFECTLINITLRPVFAETGNRVPPSDLVDYRADHYFCAPWCLCASNTRGPGFTETAIYVAVRGPYAGEYVAGCATDTCGYLSKSFYMHTEGYNPSEATWTVNLERLYALRGLLVRRYPVRCKYGSQNSQNPVYLSKRFQLLEPTTLHLPNIRLRILKLEIRYLQRCGQLGVHLVGVMVPLAQIFLTTNGPHRGF